MSTVAALFWRSGAPQSAGSLAALRFEIGRSFRVVGNVLVLGFVLGKISAFLGKISAILVLGRLASILRHPAVDFGAGVAALGRLVTVLGATWAASWGQVAVWAILSTFGKHYLLNLLEDLMEVDFSLNQ